MFVDMNMKNIKGRVKKLYSFLWLILNVKKSSCLIKLYETTLDKNKMNIRPIGCFANVWKQPAGAKLWFLAFFFQEPAAVAENVDFRGESESDGKADV